MAATATAPARTAPVRIVPLDTLKVEREYQRPLRQGWVRWLARSWDWRKAGLLTLSQRKNGDLMILEGQHRVEALRLRGEQEAPAYVMEGLSLEQEADIYVGRNTHRATTTMEMFRARLRAKEKSAVEVAAIAADNGFDMTSKEYIKAPSAVEAVHAWGVLPETLSSIQAIWGNRNVAAAAGNIVLGMGALYKMYDGEIDRSRLVNRLRGVDPIELVTNARMRARYERDGRLWAQVARLLVSEYNRGQGVRLPDKGIPTQARSLWLKAPTGGKGGRPRGRKSQQEAAASA